MQGQTGTQVRGMEWFDKQFRDRPGMDKAMEELPEADRQVQGVTFVPGSYFNDGSSIFGWPAPDNSMTGKGIMPGDLLIVRTMTPDPGDVVLMTIRGRLCARIYRPATGGRALLESTHPDFPAVSVKQSTLINGNSASTKFHGVVILSQRKLK